MLAGLDLGSVLGAFEVAHFGRQLFDGANEAANLGVEGVYDAPQQVFALIGDLEAVGGRARGDDAEGFGHRPYGVVTASDIVVVELAALQCRAKEWAFSQMVEVTEVSAKGSISKVKTMAAFELALKRTGRYPAVMDCWDRLAQGSRASARSAVALRAPAGVQRRSCEAGWRTGRRGTMIDHSERRILSIRSEPMGSPASAVVAVDAPLSPKHLGR